MVLDLPGDAHSLHALEWQKLRVAIMTEQFYTAAAYMSGAQMDAALGVEG